MDESVNFSTPAAEDLAQKIQDRSIKVAVLGLGYVGLPLALAFARADIEVIGFDTDASKLEAIKAGRSYLKTVEESAVAQAVKSGKFSATNDAKALGLAGALIICVPTPLNKHREPDLSYVTNTVRTVLPHLQKGQMVSLEATTYPGTTEEIVRPILAESGLDIGTEIFLVYSPEREDPGNRNFNISSTPKVIGGENADALALARLLYSQIVETVVPVSSLATAEAVKLTENIFRAVNISLVNELKVLFEEMGIDIWEVIDAAKTKPFGYMPFYPGPGLGGHCIPVDPFYLTWKAREYGIATRFIELAGEINNAMPNYVVRRLKDALDFRLSKSMKGAKVLLVGIAYKKNVDDTRESPSLYILRQLRTAGADVKYFDPLIPVIPKTRDYPDLAGLKSIRADELEAAGYDAALICADHDEIDYDLLVKSCAITVDTRNATRNVQEGQDRIVRA